MTEKNFNMESFHHSIYLNAKCEKVFLTFGTAYGLDLWFLGKTEYTDTGGRLRSSVEKISAGDSYAWKWKTKELSIEGKVLEVIPDRSVSFTFGNLFHVTMEARQEGKRTLFTLKHSYKDGAVKNDFAYINCCACWVFFITNLKSVLECGVDLRETESINEELVNL